MTEQSNPSDVQSPTAGPDSSSRLEAMVPIGIEAQRVLRASAATTSTSPTSKNWHPEAESGETCPQCGDRKRPRDVLCEPCMERVARRAWWKDASSWQRLEQATSVIGIPRRFCFNDKCPAFTDDGLKITEAFPPGGLFITGPVGSHKTHLATARACSAAARGYSARFTSWMDFTLRVRATYSTASRETERDIIEQLAAVDYLCIDDVGSGSERDGHESEASRLLLHHLIDRRYGDNRVTTDMTSNLVLPELEKRFDERIARRIRETMTPYIMSGR